MKPPIASSSAGMLTPPRRAQRVEWLAPRTTRELGLEEEVTQGKHESLVSILYLQISFDVAFFSFVEIFV